MPRRASFFAAVTDATEPDAQPPGSPDPAPAYASPLAHALTVAWSYPAYRQHLGTLLAAGRTTGPNQSPAYLEYARLNETRMDRLDRRVRLAPEAEGALGRLRRGYTLLVLTEGWCGDAAQTVPVLRWMERAAPERIRLRVALRDGHPDLMAHFLTDGGRSIPKVLFLAGADAVGGEVLAEWGPRPLVAQALVKRHLRAAAAGADPAARQTALHRWYARDKTRSTQAELLALLSWLDGES